MQNCRVPIALAICCHLLAVDDASAQSAVLPEKAKVRILQSAAELLRDGSITREQHVDLVHWVGARPCRNVQMRASTARLQAVASAISKTEGFPNSHVLAYYAAAGWFVVYTDASAGDERYLLYRGDPASGIKSKLSWSGAATMFETTEIRDWVVRDAPGVPRQLADCFAWQVTLGQQCRLTSRSSRLASASRR